MREPLPITDEQLCACFLDQYGLNPVTLNFLPLGLDSYARVYRVVSEQGTAYLLKVKVGTLYEAACLVPRYLNEQGIISVVAPIPTRSGSLWTQLEEWTVTVYPFLDGDTSWTGMTDEQWKEVGAIFQRIHRVSWPSFGFESLRKETFDTTDYAQWIRAFETQHVHALSGASASEHALLSAWIEHQSTIHTAISTLETLGDVLQRRALPYVVCHADLHPANLLRNPLGHVFVIDWDEVMLAPRERDFLFVKASSVDSQALPGSPAFFQGYGRTEVDWAALTYYRYERVIQDLIEFAKDVFFRDNLGEGVKLESVRLFQSVLAEGGEIDAASQASTHLPVDLAILIKRNAR